MSTPALFAPALAWSGHLRRRLDAHPDLAAWVAQAAQPVSYTHLDVYKRQAWCGPCKMSAPILEEVATEYAGRLTIAKLNVDENQGTAAKYGIRGIPTLMLFKDCLLYTSRCV